jgi:hypothetical protein
MEREERQSYFTPSKRVYRDDLLVERGHQWLLLQKARAVIIISLRFRTDKSSSEQSNELW